MTLSWPTLPLAASADELMQHVLPHTLWGKFTNHMLMMLIVAVLLILVFAFVGAKARTNLVPTGVHNFFESILSFLRTELIRPALGANADRFAPFLWTVFFFILFCNLLGMIPINELVTVGSGLKGPVTHAQHFWGTATANLSVTAGLAVIAFIIVHLSGIIQQIRVKMDPSLAPHHGGHDHAEPHGHGQMHGMEGIEDERDVKYDHTVGDGHDHAHGVHHSKQFNGQPFPVAVFTSGTQKHGATAEAVGIGVHWALTGGVGVMVVIGCTLLSCLELFVAFLQAYIFTFLTTLFIASAVAPEH